MVCSIEGCAGDVHQRGWCNAHYKRWYRHGDPLAGSTPNGAALRYFHEIVMFYDGDECLAWPYSRNHGYGRLWIDGDLQNVSRVVCERIHGKPPTSKHEAAHSCGNGHLGCVAKRHLSWKTPLENGADKAIHGRQARGERHYGSKLTQHDVHAIRAMDGKKSSGQIATMFGVSPRNVRLILARKNWAWLEARQ